MKHIQFIFFAVILVAGCGKKELSRDEAIAIMKKERGYPKVIDHDIYTADPAHAKRLLDKGLEAEGLVVIQKTQKWADIGKPLIEFTSKSTPYLLQASETGAVPKIQKVKIADEEIADVTAIIDRGSNTVEVQYNTVYKNITPFAVLVNYDTAKLRSRSSTFSLSDEGWTINSRKR